MAQGSSGQGQGRPGDWGSSGYGSHETQVGPGSQYGTPGSQQYGAPQAQYGTPQPQYSDPTANWVAASTGGATSHAASRQASDSKGFLASLFDFSFSSLITTKVIKAIYVLVTIVLFLVALGYTFVAFRVSAPVGLVVLIIGDPLYIIISMALWRMLLEFFIVIFRMGEDIRTIRDRGGLQ